MEKTIFGSERIAHLVICLVSVLIMILSLCLWPGDPEKTGDRSVSFRRRSVHFPVEPFPLPLLVETKGERSHPVPGGNQDLPFVHRGLRILDFSDALPRLSAGHPRRHIFFKQGHEVGRFDETVSSVCGHGPFHFHPVRLLALYRFAAGVSGIIWTCKD